MKKTYRQNINAPDFFSKNQGHAIKYRKRLQEDAEIQKELKAFIKDVDANQPIQDPVRREYFP